MNFRRFTSRHKVSSNPEQCPNPDIVTMHLTSNGNFYRRKSKNHQVLLHFKSNQIVVQSDGFGNTGVSLTAVATHNHCME